MATVLPARIAGLPQDPPPKNCLKLEMCFIEIYMIMLNIGETHTFVLFMNVKRHKSIEGV